MLFWVSYMEGEPQTPTLRLKLPGQALQESIGVCPRVFFIVFTKMIPSSSCIGLYTGMCMAILGRKQLCSRNSERDEDGANIRTSCSSS